MLFLSATQGDVGQGSPVVADQSAVALTTVLTGASYTAPANSLKAGQVYYLRNEMALIHTAATTPVIAVNLLIGTAAISLSLTPLATAGTFRGFVEGFITVRSIGTSASVRASLRMMALGLFTAGAYGGGDSEGALTRNTTTALQLALKMNMTTAVAGNTLTIGQGFVSRIFG